MCNFLGELKKYLLSIIMSSTASPLIESIMSYTEVNREGDLNQFLRKVQKVKNFYNFLC